MPKIVNITIIVEGLGIMVHKSVRNIYSSVTFSKKIADAADSLHALETVLFNTMEIDINCYKDTDIKMTKLKSIENGLCGMKIDPFIIIPKTMTHISIPIGETLSLVGGETILKNIKSPGFYSAPTIDVINYLNERCML